MCPLPDTPCLMDSLQGGTGEVHCEKVQCPRLACAQPVRVNPTDCCKQCPGERGGWALRPHLWVEAGLVLDEGKGAQLIEHLLSTALCLTWSQDSKCCGKNVIF